MSEQEQGHEGTGFSILTDDEFLAMVAGKGHPDELNQAMLTLRREGRIQLFDDGSGDPLVVTLERTN
jgi:hypothetical protein